MLALCGSILALLAQAIAQATVTDTTQSLDAAYATRMISSRRPTSPAAPSSTPTVAASTSSTTDGASDAELSAGAIAGISIGALAALALLVSLVIALVKYARRTRAIEAKPRPTTWPAKGVQSDKSEKTEDSAPRLDRTLADVAASDLPIFYITARSAAHTPALFVSAPSDESLSETLSSSDSHDKPVASAVRIARTPSSKRKPVPLL